MADEAIELTEVQVLLDALVGTPSDEEFIQLVRGHSPGALAGAAAKLALAGGGGLPSQWTDGGNGDVTARVDDASLTPIIIWAIAGTELAAADLFSIYGETALLLAALSPRGELTLSSATVLGQAGGSIFLQSSATGTQHSLIADDGSGVSQAGFFGAAATARPTGVPVTAEGIHAALVALGLITA